MRLIRKWVAAVACISLLPLAGYALEISDTRYLGSIVPGVPAGDPNEEAYVQKLVDMGPSTTETVSGNFFTRSANDIEDLPTPVVYETREDGIEDPDDPFQIDLGSGFAYLLAKYGSGGEGQSSHVWYVGGLTGTQSIPGNVGGNLSHVSLFNPVNGVPDGGLTIMLLGAAMAGLGFANRKLRKV